MNIVCVAFSRQYTEFWHPLLFVWHLVQIIHCALHPLLFVWYLFQPRHCVLTSLYYLLFNIFQSDCCVLFTHYCFCCIFASQYTVFLNRIIVCMVSYLAFTLCFDTPILFVWYPVHTLRFDTSISLCDLVSSQYDFYTTLLFVWHRI